MVADVLAVLEKETVARCNEYAVREDRLRSLGGNLMIKAFTADLPILFGGRGKPFKLSPPYFNVSHSGELFGIFLSDDGETGFDIQKIRHAKREFVAYAIGETGGTIQSDADFVKRWTVKESAAKLTGEGIADFKNQNFSGVDGNSFYYRGKNIYYKTFMRGEYAISACSYQPVSAEITVIACEEILRKIKLKHDVL